MAKETFKTLNAINVNGNTEKKNGLTYLSWAWAWAEVKKAYPDAEYTIYKNADDLPYVYDPKTGYMCYTTVTIEGLTHEMWLPVMDSANHAMKAEPYTIVNRYGKETVVEAATMFDVNKTVMRCLTKNLAMHGLGLYIYAGEDIPEEEKEAEIKAELAKTKTSKDMYVEAITKRCKEDGIPPTFVWSLFNAETPDSIDVNKLAQTLSEKAWKAVKQRFVEA